MAIVTMFVQVLLISEALEISAQRCLEAPFPTESDLQDYKSLLAACLPSCVFNGQAQALLSAIGQLGKVITAFSSKKDMKGQAQQAISAVIAFLKEPQGQTETTSSAPFFDSEILDLAAAQARELEDMGKKISDVSTWRSALSFGKTGQAITALSINLLHWTVSGCAASMLINTRLQWPQDSCMPYTSSTHSVHRH